MKKNIDTMQLIMELGQGLMQERGYNAISYADIAEEIGIRKASIHYYFPSKQDLVHAVLQRYRKNFMNDLKKIEPSLNSEEKLFQFFNYYRKPLTDNFKLCLCSILAAEIFTFPIKTQDEINGFFRDNEKWLKKIIEQGQLSGNWSTHIDSNEQSQIIMAFVQGAQLLARSSGNIKYYDEMMQGQMKNLKSIKRLEGV